MKTMIFAGFLASLSVAGANEVLKCDFSEPFFGYKFNPKTKKIRLVTPNGTQLISRNGLLKFVKPNSAEETQAVYPGDIGSQFQLINGDTNRVLVELTFTKDGNDGMSDSVYPFDAKSNDPTFGEHIGACYTTSAPRYNPFNIMSELITATK